VVPPGGLEHVVTFDCNFYKRDPESYESLANYDRVIGWLIVFRARLSAVFKIPAGDILGYRLLLDISDKQNDPEPQLSKPSSLDRSESDRGEDEYHESNDDSDSVDSDPPLPPTPPEAKKRRTQEWETYADQPNENPLNLRQEKPWRDEPLD
jgi:hypothetical protein